MVVAVGLLFYFVMETLPNQQRAYDDYHRSKLVGSLGAEADVADEMTVSDATSQELNKLREESQQAVDRVHANDEHRTIALAEEQKRRESEAAMAAELARETAEASAMGLVTAVALKEGFFTFKPVGQQQISEGLVIALRRADDDYIICEAVVTRFYEESGEYVADIRNNDFSSKNTTDRPTPKEGDLVVVSPFATADQLRADGAMLPDLTVPTASEQ